MDRVVIPNFTRWMKLEHERNTLLKARLTDLPVVGPEPYALPQQIASDRRCVVQPHLLESQCQREGHTRQHVVAFRQEDDAPKRQTEQDRIVPLISISLTPLGLSRGISLKMTVIHQRQRWLK